MERPKTRKLSHDDYKIGWVCALPCEMAAAGAMLDERHDDLSKHGVDNNAYILGSFGVHNVVIACLPSGRYGTNSAAVVAIQLLNSFQSVRFGVLVGIGGGVPGEEMDLRLGDIVVSKPTGTFGGVVQYDLGKTIGDGSFVRTGSLDKPPTALLTAVTKLEAEHLMGYSKVPGYLSEMVGRHPEMKARFTHPGLENDRLFRADYEHLKEKKTCEHCNKSMELERTARQQTSPRIHYGTIASGNQVMKHGQTRDRLGKEFGVICFEMEASGLMDSFPCLVVRGICDYADSHKADRWQEYAAATAAAYAKELLSVIPAEMVRETTVAAETIIDSGSLNS
jgi:nucleoside phosphorylase